MLSIFLFVLLPLQLLGSMILEAALGWHTLISKYADLCLSQILKYVYQDVLQWPDLHHFQSFPVTGWNPGSTST